MAGSNAKSASFGAGLGVLTVVAIIIIGACLGYKPSWKDGDLRPSPSPSDRSVIIVPQP